MPDLRTIVGLDQTGRAFIERVFEHYLREVPEATFHPSVDGAWYIAYNPVTESVDTVDGATTVADLQQLLRIKELS